MRNVWILGLAVACSGGDDDGTTEPTETGTSTPTGSDTGTTSPGVELEPFVDGSRLKAVYREAGGEAPRLDHWWDSSLQTPCVPRMDEAFDLRCLPRAGASLVYLDEACTEAGYEVSSCEDAPPSHVATSRRERCVGPTRASAFEVGKAVVVDTIYLSGSCERVDLGRDVTVRRLTPVADSAFVALTPRHVALDGGLGVRVLEGDDGSSQVFDLVATGPDQVCQAVMLGEDFDEYCLHGDLAYDFGRLYADATCEGDNVAYTIGADACDPPTHVLGQEFDETCQRNVTRLRAIGPAVAEAYQGSPDACSPAIDDRHTHYEVGEPVDNTLPPLTTAAFGDGRMRTPHYVTPAGQPLVPSFPGWFDETLGAPCLALETETHGTRCLPAIAIDLEEPELYADATCTEPVVRSLDEPCGQEDVPVLYGIRAAEECGFGPLRDVRRVGARHEGPVYREDGDCVLHEQADVVYHLVGEAAPLEDYAEIASRGG